MGVGLSEWNTINSRRGRFYTPLGHGTNRGFSSSKLASIDFPLFDSNPIIIPSTTIRADDVALNAAIAQWEKASGYAAKGDEVKANELKDRIVRTNTEKTINSLGYQYLNGGYGSIAADIFKRNIAAHPNSWNAYDSLGDAYSQLGLRVMAIDSYNTALKLAVSDKDKTSISTKIKRLR